MNLMEEAINANDYFMKAYGLTDIKKRIYEFMQEHIEKHEMENILDVFV